MSAYQELVQLTKEYLKQEYPDGGWITSDLDTVQHFREMARIPLPTKKPSPAIIKAPVKKPVTIAVPSVKKEPVSQSVQEEKKEAPKEEKTTYSPVRIQLEPFEGKPIDLTAIKALIKEHCPTIKLIEEVPSPQPVKKVSLFIYQPDKEEYNFLCNVKKALIDRNIPADIQRGDNQHDVQEWYDELVPEKHERIITTKTLFQKLPQLTLGAQLSEDKKELNKIPLILIEEINNYLKDPKLKRTLWQTLCQEFQIQ